MGDHKRAPYEVRVAQAKERQQREFEKRMEERKKAVEVRREKSSLASPAQIRNAILLMEIMAWSSKIDPSLLDQRGRLEERGR